MPRFNIALILFVGVHGCPTPAQKKDHDRVKLRFDGMIRSKQYDTPRFGLLNQWMVELHRSLPPMLPSCACEPSGLLPVGFRQALGLEPGPFKICWQSKKR